MGLILKTNTAVRITVGPFISITDGYTEKTGMTPSNLKLNIWKDMDDGSAPTKTANDISLTSSGGGANDLVELSNGYYDLELTATQLNFVGRGKLQIYDVDQVLPYWEDLFVLAGDVYNALIGNAAGKIGAHVISNANNVLTASAIANGAITSDKFATDAISATSIAAAAVTKIQSGLSTLTAQNVWEYGTRTLSSFGSLISTIWATLTSGLTTEGSIGKHIVDNLDAAVSTVGGGTGLTAQETRDAMQLAPTAGTPGEGSIDAVLADLSSRIPAALVDGKMEANATAITDNAAIAAAVIAGMTGATVTITSPIYPTGDMLILKGADYTTQLTWAFTYAGDLTGYTAAMNSVGAGIVAKAVTIAGSAGAYTITATFTNAQTLALISGKYPYSIKFTKTADSTVIPDVIEGQLTVRTFAGV